MDLLSKFFLTVTVGISTFFSGPVKITPTSTQAYTQQVKNITLTTLSNKIKENKDVSYRMNSNTGRLSSLVSSQTPLSLKKDLSKETSPEKIARIFLEEYGSLFGIKNQKSELALSRIDGIQNFYSSTHNSSMQLASFDPQTMSHVRFSQVYKEIPVFRSETIVHINADKEITSVNTNFVPDINNLTTKPLLTQKLAKNYAEIMAKTDTHTSNLTATNAEITIIDPSFITPSKPQKILAWQVEINGIAQNEPISATYFINAQTGQKIGSLNNMYTLSRYIYDCGNSPFECPVWPDKFARSEQFNAQNTRANMLFDLVGKAHFFYINRFGINGANHSGGTGNNKLHHGPSEGEVAPNNPQMLASSDKTYAFLLPMVNAYANSWSIGIGDGYNDQLLSQDVVVHEYTHIVANNFVKLVYWYQSGAMNEGISDTFAVAGRGTDWMLRLRNGFIFRNLMDPTNNQQSDAKQPDRLYSPLYDCKYEELHTNSGIFNKASYLLAEGTKKEPGGQFNGCKFDGLGRTQEERIIFQALSTCLTPTSNFGDYASCLISTCAYIFGPNSKECAIVHDVTEATEIAQQPSGRNRGASCTMNPDQCPDSNPSCDLNPVPRRNPTCSTTTLQYPFPGAQISQSPTRIPLPSPDIPECERTGGRCVLYEESCSYPYNGVSPDKKGCSTICCADPDTLTPSPSPTDGPPRYLLPSIPASTSTCRPMYNMTIADTSYQNLGSSIPNGKDFFCSVSTDIENNATACGLQINGGYPKDICRKTGSYGYASWSGNTVTFRCNTRCIDDPQCLALPVIPPDANLSLIGFDFSPSCGYAAPGSYTKSVSISN